MLILGLDGAGKTTILYRLQVGEVVTTIPSTIKIVACARSLPLPFSPSLPFSPPPSPYCLHFPLFHPYIMHSLHPPPSPYSHWVQCRDSYLQKPQVSRYTLLRHMTHVFIPKHSYLVAVWDLGGQTSIRPYWRCYYANTDAIIYVVDSADRDRLAISKSELVSMLEVHLYNDSVDEYFNPLVYSLPTYNITFVYTLTGRRAEDCSSHGVCQ